MFSQLTRYASELDVQIDDAEMEVRMGYDTRGKLGLADVSPACDQMTYVLQIKSPAPPDKVRQVVELIEKGCHTINTLRNPVPVSGKLIHNGQEVKVAGP
jgi:hypothetical protein